MRAAKKARSTEGTIAGVPGAIWRYLVAPPSDHSLVAGLVVSAGGKQGDDAEIATRRLGAAAVAATALAAAGAASIAAVAEVAGAGAGTGGLLTGATTTLMGATTTLMGMPLLASAGAIGAAAAVVVLSSSGIFGAGPRAEKLNSFAAHAGIGSTTAARPLLEVDHEEDKLAAGKVQEESFSRTSPPLEYSSPEAAADVDIEVEVVQTDEVDEEAPVKEEDTAPPKRDPWRGQRKHMLRKTEELVRGWSAALALSGIDLQINGCMRRVSLKPPSFTSLLIRPVPGEDDRDDEETDAQDFDDPEADEIPLVGLALHLKDNVVTLRCGAANEEEIYAVETDHADTALQLVLTLKVLRGHADTGGGVLHWHERQPDIIERPPPAE